MPASERWLNTKFRDWLRPGVIAAFPEMHARLQGIAEGAGISLRSLYLFIGLEALMASIDGRITIPALAAACSAVAIRGRRSADGQPIIARNFDYLPIVQPFYSLRESQPVGGMRSLEFITAPMAGTIDGVNEAGLCITYNYAFTLDRPNQPAGMISMVISEALASCRTVAEAAEWITSRPRWGGGLLMLADPNGDIASLELSSTRSKLRRPDGDADLIYHTNCFGDGEMCEAQVPATAVFTDRVPTPLRGRRVLQSAERRRDQFQRLVSRHAAFDAEQLRQILGDHGASGQPSDDSLCMHGSYWTTTASLSGIVIRDSDHNLLKESTVTGSVGFDLSDTNWGNGISLVRATFNTLDSNKVSGNARNGIFLDVDSHDNIVKSNTSTKNNVRRKDLIILRQDQGYDYRDDSPGTAPGITSNLYSKNKGKTQNVPGLIQTFV